MRGYVASNENGSFTMEPQAVVAAAAAPVVVELTKEEARRAKARQYFATFKAAHPERVKAAKKLWHEKAREVELARRAEIYRRAREDPAYVERRREESRAYNATHKEERRAARLRYKERKLAERLVIAKDVVVEG